MDGLKRRKCIVWCVAGVCACVPVVTFAISLRRAEQSLPTGWGWSRFNELMLAPGVYPAMMTASWVVQVVASALFWGIVGGALSATVLLTWRDRGLALRTVTVLGGFAAVYAVLVARMWAGWNPD